MNLFARKTAQRRSRSKHLFTSPVFPPPGPGESGDETAS